LHRPIGCFGILLSVAHRGVKKIGLLAGWGSPLNFAKADEATERILEGFANEDFSQYPDARHRCEM